MANEGLTKSPKQRMIRVFVSSTFRDMKEEREELVKRVFPRLRKICEQRGVTWGDVDLRWGITDEEKAEGKVLPICLNEIHECGPYFIGLLGERYGWVPVEIPDELIEQQPWVSEHLEHSVTELEILHGVLNNPEMADHAFFYFRDPGYIDSLPSDLRDTFREVPTAYEIEMLGAEEARRLSEERTEKLVSLKGRIRESGLPVHENYKSPKELGDLVYRDFINIIDQLFPQAFEPDPLDLEGIEHEVFALNRFGVYVGRQEYFDRLEANLKSHNPPIVILGDAGSGKSALLANWSVGYRNKHPDELLVTHFIGATPSSADWVSILRRIIAEIKRYLDIEMECPAWPSELRIAFANCLFMASAAAEKQEKLIVIILDGLDQLEDREGALDLTWLPPVIPENIRFVFSTLPGRPLDELTKRGWPTTRVEPLDIEERKRLIREYLSQYSTALSSSVVEHIAANPQTSNPLYLRTLLEEIRLYGVHEQLYTKIEHYLAADSFVSLYDKVLDRLEKDYEHDRPGLVRDAMTLIWASRWGLPEAELLDLLGSSQLPQALWSPLYLAIEQSLMNRSGLLSFSNPSFHEAVGRRYLTDGEMRKGPHKRLAKMFHERLFEGSALKDRKSPDVRALRELPYHAREAGELHLWSEVMTDFAFLEATTLHVDVWQSKKADGSISSYYEGYFVVDDELRQGLQIRPGDIESRASIELLHEVWGSYQLQFIVSPHVIMPTLYRELSTREQPPKEIWSRTLHEPVLEGGPIWQWCEREREKYEEPGQPWSADGGYAAFICYRRKACADTAGRFYEALRNRDIDAFMDVVGLETANHFDERLLKEIEKAPNFILILTPGCLDRCVNEGDWLRREISHALKNKRKIHLILKDGFEFPPAEQIPDDIVEISTLHGIKYSHELFYELVDKLINSFRKNA